MASELVRLELAAGGHRVFRSIQELVRWIDEAEAGWQWFMGVSGGPACVSAAQKSLRQAFQAARSSLSAGYAGDDECAGAVRSGLLQTFPRGVPTSDEPAMHAIQQSYGSDQQLQAAAVGAVVFTDASTSWRAIEPTNMSNPACYSGIAIAMATRQVGSRADQSRARQAMQRASEKLESYVVQAEAKAEELLTSTQLALGETRHSLENAKDEFLSKSEEILAGIKSQAFDAIANITATENHFAELMRLKAPMDLWDDKAISHRRQVKIYRRWMTFLSSMLIPVLAAIYVGGWLAIASSKPTNSIAMTLYVAGFIGAVTAIALWFIRIVVRLYMSQHHMATDAEERAALIRTYLALSEHGAVAEQERALVLASVFRPTPDGIVKDDGAPQLSPAALLANMLEKK